ncbi:MAG TPA: EFR1 family ferrodoxin [Clostridia bacterium]|nr:EFR1 family ferrodoxin [Clostridia bacterium]
MGKNSVGIVYYSGTGGTKRVAECFQKAFEEAGHEVRMQRLSQNVGIEMEEHELLLLLYAVHACNAPKAIYDWIEKAQNVNNVPAVVVSVSGGGEVSPNTACRVGAINRLVKKGYNVIYETMLVMPSNWIVPTQKVLAKMLLEVLPKKVAAIVDAVDRGVTRRTKPHLIDRVFSRIGEAEKYGAKYFGKSIRVSESCTGCGWCSSNCPAGNIALSLNKPEFGGKCHLCLNCIYGCPNKALSPGTGSFIVIKEGYDLKELENMTTVDENVDVEKLAKGYIWSGVRKYLTDRCMEDI